jgi:phage replication O-like protein O
VRKSGNKNGFTKVDHVTFDLILPTLSTAAQSIFLRIYRQTLGWKKPTDKIATSHFTKFCNIKKRGTIKSAIDELVELDLITAEGKGTQIKEFGINFDALQKIRQEFIESQEDEN